MDWLLEEVLTGFQKLRLLRLANTPTSDDLKGCAAMWIDGLMEARDWEMDRDRPAIREAFTTLLTRKPADGRPVFWPAPGDLLAALPQPKAAPYHQPFPKDRYALGWDRNAGNKSTIAKAHATFNSMRLGLPVPAWCMPNNDAEGTAIERMVVNARDDEKARAEEIRRNSRELAGKEAPVVEPDSATRSGDGGAHRSPLEDSGAVERCAGWEVYRAASGER